MPWMDLVWCLSGGSSLMESLLRPLFLPHLIKAMRACHDVSVCLLLWIFMKLFWRSHLAAHTSVWIADLHEIALAIVSLAIVSPPNLGTVKSPPEEHFLWSHISLLNHICHNHNLAHSAKTSIHIPPRLSSPEALWDYHKVTFVPQNEYGHNDQICVQRCSVRDFPRSTTHSSWKL